MYDGIYCSGVLRIAGTDGHNPSVNDRSSNLTDNLYFMRAMGGLYKLRDVRFNSVWA